MFLTRAVAVRRDFTANGEVAQICERLDNLPLAIELAAARVRLLSPRALLERLEQRLPRLSGGPKTHPIGTVDTTNRLHATTATAATRTAGKVRIWWRNGIETSAKAGTVASMLAAEIDTNIWPKLTALMSREPRSRTRQWAASTARTGRLTSTFRTVSSGWARRR